MRLDSFYVKNLSHQGLNISQNNVDRRDPARGYIKGGCRGCVSSVSHSGHEFAGSILLSSSVIAIPSAILMYALSTPTDGIKLQSLLVVIKMDDVMC